MLLGKHLEHTLSMQNPSENEWAEIRVLFSGFTGRFRKGNEKGNR
jgi:hypothetical protein